MKFPDLLEEYLCAALLMFMAVLTFANVIVRYLTDGSLAFTEELVVNLFVLATMLGASMAFKRGAHLGITFVFDWMPLRWKKVTVILTGLCSITIFVILLLHGTNMVQQEYQSGMKTYSMGLPMWWFGLAIPIGVVIVLARIVQTTIAEYRTLMQK